MESHYFLCQPQRHNVRGICPRLGLIPGITFARRKSEYASTYKRTRRCIRIQGKSVSSSEPYIYIKWPDSRVKGFWLCFMRSRKTFFPFYDTNLNSLLIKHTRGVKILSFFRFRGDAQCLVIIRIVYYFNKRYNTDLFFLV